MVTRLVSNPLLKRVWLLGNPPASGCLVHLFFFFQAEDGIRDDLVTGVQTCALPISMRSTFASFAIVRLSSPPPHATASTLSGTAAGRTASSRSCDSGEGPPLSRTEIGRASCRERV